MSRSLNTWYSLPDLDLFARRESVLEGELPLARLDRLTDLLSTDAGSVRARLAFRQHADGCVLVEFECSAQLNLICQRCLESMPYETQSRVSYAFVEGGSVGACLPEGVEGYELGNDRFNPARVIEDELIVSLPLVPRHADRRQCGRLAESLDAESPEGFEGAAGVELRGSAAPVNH